MLKSITTPRQILCRNKTYNWNTLNQKVFKKLGFQVAKKDINSIVEAAPEAIERVLKLLKDHIENYHEMKKSRKSSEQSTPSQTGIRPYQHVMAGIDMNIEDGMGNSENMQNNKDYLQSQVDTEILIEKEQTIQELRETIGILEIKLKKFEQLVKLKDQKVRALV
jgi:hypothetical protein